jgi:hypothetical protein
MKIFEDVGARWMIPIHHGTFFQSGSGEEAAIARAVARHHLEDRVVVLGIGQAIRLHPRP